MRKFLLIAVAAGLLPILAVAAAPSPIDLPQMGEPADVALSASEEAKIAVEIVHELYGADYVIDDYELSDYITALGWKLAAGGAPNPPRFRFFPIPDTAINAAAFPGGVIIVNAGTVMASSNESELAAVVAHEEAHVTQRHIARELNNTQAADLATWAAMLAAIIAGAGNPSVVLGALSLGQGINYNRMISYTRMNEMEADRIGIRTLANAGFDPDSMASFFARLEQQTRLYGAGLPELLQSHPVNTTRIAEASERAAEYPKRPHPDSADYLLMRARTRVLMAELPGTAADYFRSQVTQPGATPDQHYGYAFALAQMNHYAEALDALAPVLAAYPKQAQVQLLRANILTGLGRSDEGQQAYQQIVRNFPNYAPGVLEAARSQVEAGHNESARQLLLSHLDILSTQIDATRLLAQAASATGNMAEAQFQTANYYFERGDARGAIEQLDSALRLSSLAPDERARLLARRREFVSMIMANPNSQGR